MLRNILNPNNPLVKKLSSSRICKTHVIYDQNEINMIKKYFKILDRSRTDVLLNKKNEIDLLIEKQKKDVAREMISYGIANQGKVMYTNPRLHYSITVGLMTVLNPFFYLSLTDGESVPIYLGSLMIGILGHGATDKMTYLRKRKEISDYVNLNQALENIKVKSQIPR